MTKVLAGITMSLDGYITGPNDRLGAGLGDGGEKLHYWVFGGPWTYDSPRGSPAGADQDYLDEVFRSGGAWIVGPHHARRGRRLGRRSRLRRPGFRLTHRLHETVVKGDTTFEFVTGGISDALARARAAAGGKNVIVMGGADLVRQYLAAGLVDEFTLTIAPVLLGAGKCLFDGISRTDLTFERTAVIESPFATRLRFRVRLADESDGGENVAAADLQTP